MFTERDYICVCHGCGQFHVVRSMFMSVSMMQGFASSTDSKRTWAVPCYACPDCRQTANGHRIKAAFDHGSTDESKARMQAQFSAEWEAKLEVSRKP